MIQIGDRVKVTRGLFVGIRGTVYDVRGKMLYIDRDKSPYSYCIVDDDCKVLNEKNRL
jgi:hypothetical protein